MPIIAIRKTKHKPRPFPTRKAAANAFGINRETVSFAIRTGKYVEKCRRFFREVA